MPRNPSRRFRTKEQMCEDVALVLTSSLHDGTKHAVLADVIWKWTEYNGKIKGCQFWSKAAWERKADAKSLRHEHLVPKAVLIRRLLGLKSPTQQSVFDLLDRYCIGVVVTREEDARLTDEELRSKMPNGWEWGDDPWARYELVKIARSDRG